MSKTNYVTEEPDPIFEGDTIEGWPTQPKDNRSESGVLKKGES